jgi:hypothetical protein
MLSGPARVEGRQTGSLPPNGVRRPSLPCCLLAWVPGNRHFLEAATLVCCRLLGHEFGHVCCLCSRQVCGEAGWIENAREHASRAGARRRLARGAPGATGAQAQVHQGRIPECVLGHRGLELRGVRPAVLPNRSAALGSAVRSTPLCAPPKAQETVPSLIPASTQAPAEAACACALQAQQARLALDGPQLARRETPQRFPRRPKWAVPE